MSITLTKAHAYGNDFLVVKEDELTAVGDLPDFVRRVCSRHRGVGADGVMIVKTTPAGATTRLFNADGSRSELSGNGVRCVGACLAFWRNMSAGDSVVVETEAGPKTLVFLGATECVTSFRASMGAPTGLRQTTIDVDGTPIAAVVLRVGNPQCVVLGEVSVERLHRIAAKLAVHPIFPEGTNVELAAVEAPDQVKILIWERGVGPTEASGTGACGAAVAAAAYGGANRTVRVVSPGGTQLVEWTQDDLLLTGDAEVIGEITWWLD